MKIQIKTLATSAPAHGASKHSFPVEAPRGGLKFIRGQLDDVGADLANAISAEIARLETEAQKLKSEIAELIGGPRTLLSFRLGLSSACYLNDQQTTCGNRLANPGRPPAA